MKNQYLFFCLMLLLAGMPTEASSDEVIKPFVFSTLLFDSNFLRVSDDVDPVLATGKSDKSEFIKQVAAGFDVDWTISRQQLIIKANANQNWFQNFTSLDYFGWNTQAQWNWQMRNDLNGEIGYANIKALSSFDQLNRLTSNLQNSQRYFANVGYLFHPRGRIKLDLFRSEFEFDGEGREFSNNTEDNAALNLQYISPTDSIWGLQLIATNGSYPQREFDALSTEDNSYTRMNYAMTWDWHVSSKTRVDGLLGYTHQYYEHLSSRDFADIIAKLDLHWQASHNTLLEISARREISQAQNLFSSFLLNQGIFFNLNWQSSTKVIITLPISYQEQQYLGAAGSNVVGFKQQKDNVSIIGLNLMYRPLDPLSIGVKLNYEKRDSNYSIRSYETKSVGVNLQMIF